jgi:aminoglycoside phosphotransferase (APT) family kinase protein
MEYYPDVECCLLELIGAGEPESVETSAYIDRLTDPALLGRWEITPGAEEAVTEIRLFQDQLKQWLSQQQVAPRSELVLSHGDFSLVNVIIADGQFRIIDWEGIRHGVLYADCLNFVFVEKYYQRTTTDITEETAEVMRRYGDAVAAKYPRLKDMAEVPQAVSMRLYYLDRLHLMLEREVTDNLASVVRKSIQMFRDFDSAAGFPAV